MIRFGSTALLLGYALVSAGCGGLTADAAPTAIVQAYGFKVEIDGVPTKDAWVSVDGLGLDIGTVEGSDPAAGGASSSPVGARPTTVTFRLAFDRSRTPEVEDWVRATYDGADIRKNITVTVTGPDGTELRTFNFLECFPTSYRLASPDAASGTVLHWTLEVRVNRIEMA